MRRYQPQCRFEFRLLVAVWTEIYSEELQEYALRIGLRLIDLGAVAVAMYERCKGSRPRGDLLFGV